MLILPSTTNIGDENCLERSYPGGRSARILRRRAFWKRIFHVGDRFRIGSAVLMLVRQPRMPCYKLAAKFQRDDMIDRFLVSGRSGFYLSVEQEGEVETGDSFSNSSLGIRAALRSGK